MKRKSYLKKHWLDAAIVIMILVTAGYFANAYIVQPRREAERQAQLTDALLLYWAEAKEPAEETLPPQTAPSSPSGEVETAERIDPPIPDETAETAAQVQPPAAPAPKVIDFDTVVGVLRVPSWGTSYAAVIVDGVTDADLKTAVGHFPETALPGEIGNCSLAAHRMASGGLFHKLHKLEAGNTVVVETKTHTYVYELYGEMETVPADAWDEIAPVPHERDTEATESHITLQGCEMNREGTKRVIWHGRLVQAIEK